MPVSLDTIMAIIALGASTTTLYLNFTRIKKSGEADLIWRTKLDAKLENLFEKMSEFVNAQKAMSLSISEVIKLNAAQQEEIRFLKSEQTGLRAQLDKIWSFVDTYRTDLSKIQSELTEIRMRMNTYHPS